MKELVFYRFVIIILLLLNAGILGYLFLHRDDRPWGPPQDSPADRIIMDRLRLDDRQHREFGHLKHEHHTRALALQAAAGRLHQELFQLLQAPAIDTQRRNALLEALLQNNREKELNTFDHFRKLRALLRTEQQKDFDRFVAELGNQLNAPHRPHAPRR